MIKLTPQEVYDNLEELKEKSKVIYEEINRLQKEFFDEYQDFELPIIVDSKEKYFRIYEPDGRFIYNIKLETGVRVKPQKVYKGIK